MGRARDLRLLQDQRKIYNFIDKLPFLDLKKWKGLPPSEYLLSFRLKGYLDEQGTISSEHELLLIFPEKYPYSAPPKFTFLKGLFHPNVYRSGDVCHGWYLNNWTPAIHIDDLLRDITKMICFKTDAYNLKSPANYDCNADWIAAHQTPIDSTDIDHLLNQEEDKSVVVKKHTISSIKKEVAPVKVSIKHKLPTALPPPVVPRKAPPSSSDVPIKIRIINK